MSSTLNKIADKLTGKNKEHDNPQSANYGPHGTATANKLDPTVDSDLDNRNNPASHVGGYGNTQRSGTYAPVGTGNVGDTYGSNVNPNTINDPHSTNAGPHKSNLMNKLDPRVDSDRDGRNDPTSRVGGYGNDQHTGAGGAGGVHMPSSGPGYSAGTTQHSANVGPHNSNLANKLDPRVDSDLDGRNNPASGVGGYGHNTTASTGHNPLAGSGGMHHAGPGNHQSTNAGPHSSNLANKLDPRVDSDLDSRHTVPTHTGGHGKSAVIGTGAHHGTHTGTQHYTGTQHVTEDPRSTNSGPHSSNLMNKLDPRVDSDRDGSNNPITQTGGHGHSHAGPGIIGSNTYGSAPTHHTTTAGAGAQGYTGTNTGYDNPKSANTGPHSSDLLNKLDPRVDSDRDGRDNPMSKTGGYGQTQTGSGGVGRY